MFEQDAIIAVCSAMISAITTIFVTKLKSNKEKDVTTLTTEAERISIYMENINELLEVYQKQIDDLREEIKSLTLENRKLRTTNQKLVSQIAQLNAKINNLEKIKKSKEDEK